MPGQKVLIVEDDVVTITAVKDRLEFEGLEVETAKDGEKGLSRARAGDVGCVILDVMLPKLDGFRVCRLLKFDPKCRRIPVIILTARSQDADKAVGRETGADDYFVKPVDLDELVGKVKGHVGQPSEGRGGAR